MSWLSALFMEKADNHLLNQAKKWGKGRAKTKLRLFYAYQEKFPEKPAKELYYLTILSGSDFTEVTARELVDDAEDTAEGNIGFGLKLPSLEQSFGLRSVVKHLLLCEEFERFGFNGFPHPQGMPEAFMAVDDVIPEDL